MYRHRLVLIVSTILLLSSIQTKKNSRNICSPGKEDCAQFLREVLQPGDPYVEDLIKVLREEQKQQHPKDEL